MNSAYNRPQCGSENTTRSHLAHSQGTSSGRFRGAGITSGGTVGAAVGRMDSQTNFAQVLHPPVKPVMRPFVVISIVVIGFVAGSIMPGIFWIVTLLATILPLVVYHFMLQRHMPAYHEALNKRSQNMVCLR